MVNSQQNSSQNTTQNNSTENKPQLLLMRVSSVKRSDSGENNNNKRDKEVPRTTNREPTDSIHQQGLKLIIALCIRERLMKSDV